ncbi:MAG: thiamine-monophosphate kinase [Candidatus Omnitrophica bacterium]|nr:thiamine-monophosphate kinase [Candidatus Omnitrophota bacterium]
MQISRIGEFGLIERIKKLTRTDSSVIKGIGDDCAVIRGSANKYLLFTCDMLIEGVDFRPKDRPYLIGRKSLAVSLSDIAACAGKPGHCLVSLGINKNTKLEKVDAIYKGMLDLARRYKVNIVGGDISRADKLTIDVSMLGEVEKKYLILRSGARPGDIVFVSGSLGGSIRGRHLSFEPRLKEARFLAENFKPSAMIDISDGLAQDLRQILKASGVGGVLYEELIPLARQARSLREALYMGEDFELLFTLSRSQANRLFMQGLKLFRPIGEITKAKSGLKLIDRENRIRFINSGGFRHF